MDPTPFVAPDAEVTLHTSDGISFRVYSRILIEASPFFRDLLGLPQPAIEKNAPTAVVDVPENSKVMHALLSFVYPIEEPPIDELTLLGEVLGAALKYDMAHAVQSLRRLLISPEFLYDSPERVYAIACRHHLESEAKIASTHTLTVNILDAPLAEELKYITAFDYHRLLALHRTRGAAAQKLLNNANIRCWQCSGGQFGLANSPKWWVDWAVRAKEELQLRPTGDVVFSLAFLAKSAVAGCPRCGGSILEAHEALMSLKRAIDELPATI
ncbi:hypothetical protein K439DRAFT_398953 [Ramaria rubella]|nr:hypothetical protein K439DRAFT_398953 [Ramaria rubella]